MMINSKFDFYEFVEICTTDKKLEKINGKEGAVLGKSLGHTGEWYYAVSIPGDFTYSLYEHQLRSLNRFAKREDFYTGESIKVSVNEKGEGFLKEED